jgi:transportin-3
MLNVIRSFGDVLPAACATSCQEAWAVFEPFLARYGGTYDVSERSTRVFRHALTLFGAGAAPVAASALRCMALSFEKTGFPGYVWITGKLVAAFSTREDPTIQAAVAEAYERTTKKVVVLLQEKPPASIPDG